jgi:hypothetical protein
MAMPGLVLALAGPGPDGFIVRCVPLGQADQEPADLWERVADHARVAGAGPFYGLGPAGGEPGQGEHGQGDVGVPGPPGADLVVIQPGLALSPLEALFDMPRDQGSDRLLLSRPGTGTGQKAMSQPADSRPASNECVPGAVVRDHAGWFSAAK